MEYKTNDNYWTNGFPNNESYSLLELKAFQLISIINASQKTNSIKEFKEYLVRYYELFEVSNLLIELAVQIRNRLDLNNIYDEQILYRIGASVGNLITDLEMPENKKVPLTFREACNKIIHTNHINFDLNNPINLFEYESLNKTVYLYGDFRGKPWKAELDTIEFVRVLLCLK